MASPLPKKANHDDIVGLDRISNLPHSVLARILSLLPIKDSVSTSILSNRWRYLYTSVFNLEISLNKDLPLHLVKSISNFIDKLLFFHAEGRFEQFQLRDVHASVIDFARLVGWISAAVWRGVKDLELEFYPLRNYEKLHLTVLFFSKTLVRLILNTPCLVTVPVHVVLPSLKTLKVRQIGFEDDDSVQRLISSCPVLEDLSIHCCNLRNIEWLIISNPSVKNFSLLFNRFFPVSEIFKIAIDLDLPSLVYFRYKGLLAENFTTVNTPSLARADINIIYGQDIRDQHYHQRCLIQLLEGIGNAKALQLAIYPEALPILSHKRHAAFENLIGLEIDHTLDWNGMGLFEFLEFSPNLQSLVIHMLPDKVSIPMEKVASCLLYRLKEIKVFHYDEENSVFEMVSYILKNAGVLEELTIYVDKNDVIDYDNDDLDDLDFSDGVMEERIARLNRKLMRLPNSSNKCRFEQECRFEQKCRFEDF